MTNPVDRIQRTRQAMLIALNEASSAGAILKRMYPDADLTAEEMRTVRESADQIAGAVSAVRAIQRLQL